MQNLQNLDLSKGVTPENMDKLKAMIIFSAQLAQSDALPEKQPTEEQAEELISIGNEFTRWALDVVSNAQSAQAILN